MTFALNGLAAGLGVLYPNLKETNPNKIVSGFGGTLCLVLSSHLHLRVARAAGVRHGGGSKATAGWVVVSIITFVALSFVIGWLPMQLGLEAVEKFRGLGG